MEYLMKNCGLVLSWWWVNGFVYIWMMKYLEEVWIKPKIVWGTSVWAVFSAMISAWFTREEMLDYALELEKDMKKVKDIDWKKISKWTMTANLKHINWLIKWDNIKSEIANLLKSKSINSFSKMKIPYFLHMVELDSWEDIRVFSENSKYQDKNPVDFIRGSISIPWIFKPHKIWSKYYIDWGAKSNYPVLSVKELALENWIEIDTVLSINIIPDFEHWDKCHKDSFIEIMLKAMSISIFDQYESDMDRFKIKYPETKLVNVWIKKIFKNSILTANISEAIEYWYLETKKQLEAIL